MNRSILVTAGGLIGLAILVAAAAGLYLGMTAKARVEATASAGLGMEVKVEGRSAVGIFPHLHITLEDVHARSRGAEVATAERIDLGVPLSALLHRGVGIESIAISRLQITVRQRLEFSGCNLDVDQLRMASGDGPGSPKDLVLAARLACEQVRTEHFTASDLVLAANGQGGLVDLAPVTMKLMGGLGSGSVHMDFTGPEPVYQVAGRLAQFRVEEFFKALSPTTAGTGLLDFSVDLSLKGPMTGALLATAAGKAALRGTDLGLQIGDLDQKLARYESSQNFNLVDVGAVFFAGPLGLGIAKGFDFARLFQETSGGTIIRTLVSEWRVEHGVAHATDVAMATPRNRLALQGSLDFVNDRFFEVTVALLDAKGCAQVQQKIRGPFSKPQVEKPSALSQVAGPTRRLVAQLRGLFGEKCEVFYSGSVAAPGSK